MVHSGPWNCPVQQVEIFWNTGKKQALSAFTCFTFSL